MAPITPLQDLRVTKIETRATSACERALTIRITSQGDAAAAAAFLNDVINPLIKEGDELFDPMIKSAYQTHQLAIGTKKKAVGALAGAKATLRLELARWQQLQEELARAEQLRREQEARDAEAARIEQELAAVEASGLSAADAAEEVAAIIEAPRALTMQPPAPPQKIEGISTRDVYRAEVHNPREFYKAIGDGRISCALAEPNQGALNRMASAMKDGFNVPGCRVTKTKAVNSAARSSF